MNQLISVCGLLCNTCDYFNKNCQGCLTVKGTTFWSKDAMPDGLCPLYKCAIIEKKYQSCGQCADLPCSLFTGLKDPNITDEQHKKSIAERVKRLKAIKYSA